MSMYKRNHIISAMRYHKIVFFVVICLLLFGILSLPNMNKDEFPQFTIRQGVVVALYPGATAQEIEEQVTKPLERFLFTYQEVNKKTTYSQTNDGIAYVFADLRVEVTDKDEVWSKIRDGLTVFRQTSLPRGVVATVVIDDFGNTSSVLLAIESTERTPRELEHYTTLLSDRLRQIGELGNLKVLGSEHEEIAVTVDLERLARYNISQPTLLAELATQGLRTTGGTLATPDGKAMLHINIPYSSEYELQEQIVLHDPMNGNEIRLRDIATIERRYRKPTQYVRYYEHAADSRQPSADKRGSCQVMSIEMYPGNNIVAFGEKVDNVLTELKTAIPDDIHIHRITDQPKVVDESVRSFLRDLLLSIIVVIAVMLMLFPLRTAVVASTGVPVCTAICLGLMWLTGIELNTVTLAALIVVLGMIVDDSVIVIDGYSNLLEKGYSRWYAASESTRMLFIPMTLATCSISGMFFPMTRIITGPLGEFVQRFPWAVAFALTASIFYAAWCIPYLATVFIGRSNSESLSRFERGQVWFFDKLQHAYRHLLARCFAHPWLTITCTLMLIALGGFIFTRLNVQMMPKAERSCFAVEIHLRAGSSLERTAEVSDSVARVLQTDSRVENVTAFVGSGSPRFHATYSPHMPAEDYAQLIVNTTGNDATIALLRHYSERYEHAFADAYVRFKQMDYQAVKNPIEVYVQGDDMEKMQEVSEKIKAYMSVQDELTWVHTDYDEQTPTVQISLNADEAQHYGLTQAMLSVYLGSMTSGQALTSLYEHDYEVPVTLYLSGSDTLTYEQLGDMLIPTAIPGTWVPLRQIATLTPSAHHSSITHRNNIRTITIGADLRGKTSQPLLMKRIDKYIAQQIRPTLPDGISLSYGGLTSQNDAVIPQLLWSVVAALLVMFVLLLYHFRKISTAVLSLSMSILCIFGAFLGLYLFNLDFSITALLGLVSLIGIIVRNAIIMYEYAESLRFGPQHLSVREAAFQAGLRRMRPIFLTSATTALGVVPMILAHTNLWMPMGVVICFGTIFTLPLVVTMLPVAYWKVFD